MSRSIRFVREVDDYEADAGAGHGHKEKYQALLQGAQAPGAMMALLHFPHSWGDAPDCASSNNSLTYYQLKGIWTLIVQVNLELPHMWYFSMQACLLQSHKSYSIRTVS